MFNSSSLVSSFSESQILCSVNPFQVLVQGCLVTQQNVNAVLDLVHDQIKGLEDFLAKTTTAMQYPATNEEVSEV